jgi:hypothetical protein
MNTKLKSIFLSVPNIIIIIVAVVFIIFSSLRICVDCLPTPEIDCGYCNGCHTQIDCWTHGLIKSPFILSIVILILYVAVFLIIYLKKR